MKTILFYLSIFAFMGLFESCLGTPPSEEYQQRGSKSYYEKMPEGTLMYDFSNDETFESFMGKFSLDTLFQVSRIEFPLRKIYLNQKGGKVEMYIEEKDWWRLVLEETEDYSIQYFEERKKNQRVVQFAGIENGIDISYVFELKNGSWYLVEMEDLST